MVELQELIEKLLWSLWSELGVPGGGRAHRHLVQDPEALIAFTPYLAEGETRLIGLALDWCTAHADQISKSRLLGLSKLLPNAAQQSLGRFNRALSSRGIDWHPWAEAWAVDYEPGRRRIALAKERPGLLVFRLRALAGVTTRADVLTRLLFVPREGALAAALTPEGTSRRSVERVLSELTSAGLVVVRGSPRRRRFRLRDASGLRKLTQADDLVWWDWGNVLTTLVAVRALFEKASRSPAVQRIDAVRAGEDLARLAGELGVEPPPRLKGREDAFETLTAWSIQLAERLAAGRV